jgi:nicotinamide-nucleotide amidase
MPHKNISLLTQQLADLLKSKKWMIATAESCTGGQLSATMTDIPGSSKWFERGFVTYSNKAKHEILGVKLKTLNQFGSVSSEVAEEMARGALKKSHAQISISITGIAGPQGATPDKPIGTVFFGISSQKSFIQVFHKRFRGDRITIRTKATIFALITLINFLKSSPF